MADLAFYWDPICPWAWITSRWIVNVTAERPITVDWPFISLLVVNEDTGYEPTKAEQYRRNHGLGLELLRVAAAVRTEVGPEAVFDYYTAVGRAIHVERRRDELFETGSVEAILQGLGHPPALAAARSDTGYDTVIRDETAEALRCCGGSIGTPVLTFGPPDGPSFFGPVINRAPTGEAALVLWDAVVTLARDPHFSELKRSLRGEPVVDG